MEAILTTEGLLGGLRPTRSGKVRDIYALGNQLLIVATDRISTYDVIHPTGIPGKGIVLTALTIHWLNKLPSAQPHHFITSSIPEYPEILRPYEEVLAGRSMLVKKAEVFPVECVVRGYLAGSGLRDYQKTGAICGIPLPRGFVEGSKLPEPIFTPATKAPSGEHDINITEAEAVGLVGADVFMTIKQRSLAIYQEAWEYALARGVIIADTKFEFGLWNGQIILADEVLTPDSSRFWPADTWEPGKSQESLDKQPVRDYVDNALGWNHKPPAPELPLEIVRSTKKRYMTVLLALFNY